MKNVLIINGIHASGKSTFAQNLIKKNNTFTYYPEIGLYLREKVSFGTLHPDEEFELEVMKRELERDKQLSFSITTPVVETWHIGNMAYVLARSPHLYAHYEELFKKQLDKFYPIAILLDINWNTFKNRATDKAKDRMNELQEFFYKIFEYTLLIYKMFNVDYIIVNNDDNMAKSEKIARNFLEARGLIS